VLGDPRGAEGYELRLGLNGAEELRLTPVGRDSRVTITSDWPHPSFFGAFLPDGSDIAEDGFEATWTIPHLARALPQVSREDFDGIARSDTAFGVRFFQPNDFYQKAYRAARYGILYIALTFLTVLLVARNRTTPVHPVQYFLIGLAQATFVLLMVSYAEQIGFASAYLISAGAVTVLLTLFGWLGLSLGRRSLVLGATLVLVYAVLYLILQSEDYALLAGSTLAFLAIAATMFATRNEEWYGPEGKGLFGRKEKAVAASNGGSSGQAGG
jgi:inner membrane protein